MIMFNMGAILDLPSPEWFGDFPTTLTVHVIDSSRPQNLSSVFGGGQNGGRIVIWDDGGVEHLEEERKAWETLTVSSYYVAFRHVIYVPFYPSLLLKRTPMRTLTLTPRKKPKKTKKKTRRTLKMATVPHLRQGNASR